MARKPDLTIPPNLVNIKRGEAHHSAKFTAAQVRSIRNRYAKHVSVERLRREYGVQRKAIKEIVNRISWKHVP